MLSHPRIVTVSIVAVVTMTVTVEARQLHSGQTHVAVPAFQATCPHITWNQCINVHNGPTQALQDMYDALDLAEVQGQFCEEIEDGIRDWLDSEEPTWRYEEHSLNYTGATLFTQGTQNATDVGVRGDRFDNLWELRNTLFHEAGHVLYYSEFMAQVAEGCFIES